MGSAAPSCKAPAPAPTPIRRLTRLEYNNTVRDLLGDGSRPADAFPPDEKSLGFDNNAGALQVSPTLAEGLMTAAESVATRAVGNLGRLLPCAPAGDDACARSFIGTFGRRAFRRPLTADESARFWRVFMVGKAGGGFSDGIRLVIQTALQSLDFLYRVEVGGAPAPGASVIALTPFEIASRLSYLFWNTMPNDALLDAAASGQLANRAQITAQARRMLDDPRARPMVAHFHGQWARTDEISGITREGTAYKAFTPAIAKLQADEAGRFLENVFWNKVDGGNFEALVTSPRSSMNATLARFYGIEGPKTETFEPVTRDAAHHAGFLTLGGVAGLINVTADQSSPIHRGVFVRLNLLCDTLPPPPANAAVEPPKPSASLTTRERVAMHRSDPACNGCHLLFDPLGMAFEHFDAVGRFRDQENGKPIDARGELVGTDVPGSFDGVVGLAQKLKASRQATRCFATQWLRYAYGRVEAREDDCFLDRVASQVSAGMPIQDLVLGLVDSEAFLSRSGGAQ